MPRGIGRTAFWIVLVVGAMTLSLAVGFAIKDRCTAHVWDGYQYRTSCYNDIYALYSFRGLAEGRFPYVDGDGNDDPPPGEQFDLDGDLEYPVGTGVFIGAMSRLVDGGQAFFRANVVGLAIAGLLSAGMLALLAKDKPRALLFAFGTPVALYAFHNWDLLAVAFMVAGLLAFRARRDAATGLLLGAGAATKLFPGAILPGLALVRWRERGRAPVGMIAAAIAAFALFNVPILAINPPGWLFPWRFQSTRFPNFETSWYMIFRHGSGGGATAESFWFATYPELTGFLSSVLFLIGLAVLLRAEWKRPFMRPYAVSFGAMLIFLLTAKVYSPQFALWLLPFFVLVRIPWYAFVAFLVTDGAVWTAISAFFLAAGTEAESSRMLLVEIAVWARYGVLLWLLWLSRRAPENVEDHPSVPSARAAAPLATPR